MNKFSLLECIGLFIFGLGLTISIGCYFGRYLVNLMKGN